MTDIYSWLSLLDSLAAEGFNAANEEVKVSILTSLGLSREQWVAQLGKVAALEKRGRILARFVTVYGLPGNLSREDVFSLHLATEFARGLLVLDADEAAQVAAGRVGQWHTYLAAADGDKTLAQQYADAALIRSVA